MRLGPRSISESLGASGCSRIERRVSSRAERGVCDLLLLIGILLPRRIVSFQRKAPMARITRLYRLLTVRLLSGGDSCLCPAASAAANRLVPGCRMTTSKAQSGSSKPPNAARRSRSKARFRVSDGAILEVPTPPDVKPGDGKTPPERVKEVLEKLGPKVADKRIGDGEDGQRKD